jgi:hypothetical protein
MITFLPPLHPTMDVVRRESDFQFVQKKGGGIFPLPLKKVERGGRSQGALRGSCSQLSTCKIRLRIKGGGFE